VKEHDSTTTTLSSLSEKANMSTKGTRIRRSFLLKLKKIRSNNVYEVSKLHL
jgi:hypothetical protein